MIICPQFKFVIGHIPKTAGHALAVMLSKAYVQIEHPYNIVNDKAFSTEKYKHDTIDNLLSENPDRFKDYRFFLVLRRLPDWLFAVLWHQSLHYEYNKKGRLTKVGVGKAYDSEYKKKAPLLPPPEIVAHSTYPYFILSQHIPIRIPPKRLEWLRMEYLIEDVHNKIGIQINDIGLYHSYTKASETYLNAKTYWNDESIEYLYKNNQLWTKLEREIYDK